jgi:fatty acid desaturase
MRDWMDWMLPEAWNVEHNNRHHYNLSEIHDPDLVEANSAMIRGLDVPVAVKYVMVAFLMMTWKWYYYAPNTYKELKLAKLRREGKPLPKGVKPEAQVTFDSILLGLNPFYTMSEFFTVVIGPYFLVHFIITPLPLLVLEHYLGVEGLYRNALINMAFADVLTNIHSFVAIVTNHAGNDMYRFRDGCRPFSGSFYLRQVLASVDFSMGTDVIDLLHGWLNYQIEHHLWPNLSMLSYQKSAPAVRALCAKHGVPYIKENVFIRVKKTVDIMVGNTSMKWFPEKYEKAFLEKDAVVEASKLKGQ